MKKKFIAPEMEIEKFKAISQVITASGDTPIPGGGDPEVPGGDLGELDF